MYGTLRVLTALSDSASGRYSDMPESAKTWDGSVSNLGKVAMPGTPTCSIFATSPDGVGKVREASKKKGPTMPSAAQFEYPQPHFSAQLWQTVPVVICPHCRKQTAIPATSLFRQGGRTFRHDYFRRASDIYTGSVRSRVCSDFVTKSGTLPSARSTLLAMLWGLRIVRCGH
jgi:hypothetical protein